TYRARLHGARRITVPPEVEAGHVYHLFPVRSAERTAVQSDLRTAGIETLIHYPVPITKQPALAAQDPADCPVANRTCDEVFSLPLYPSLPDGTIDRVGRPLTAAWPGPLS